MYLLALLKDKDGVFMISSKTKEILNDGRLIEHRDMWFKRMQNLYDAKHDEFFDKHVLTVDGVRGGPKEPNRIYENPELWVEECLEDLAGKIEEIYKECIFAPPCIESDIYGVHFIDSIFGCEIFYQDEQWYNRYLTSSVGELKKPELDKCEAWQIAKRAATEFVRQGVSLPLYGLPTIASALNIAVNLYGQEILVAMLAEPEDAAHDLKIINDTLCEIHRWYRALLPADQLHTVIAWERTQPPGYGQICGCTTQLVSGEVYAEMVAPLDDALLSVYPKGGMIHLCGAHEHIIPTLRDMPHLKSVQLNDRAAVDLELHYTNLRDDQLIYLIPFENMTVKQAMEITGGKRLVFQGSERQPAAGCGCGCS